MIIIFFKKNKQICYYERKFNFNFKENIKSFNRFISSNSVNHFKIRKIKQFIKKNLEQKSNTAIQNINDFQIKIINKKSKLLKISKKLRRFLYLIPFFEIRSRFLLYSNFRYNIQKKPDFLIFLNLKFLNENNIIILEYFNNKTNKDKNNLDNNNKIFLLLILLDKISPNNMNRNNIEIFTKKKYINIRSFLKKIQSNSNACIDCIFINLNHFMFHILTKTKIIINTIEHNNNFLCRCLKNFIKKYTEPLFFSWNFKLINNTGIKLKHIPKLFNKNITFNYVFESEHSDEFGTKTFSKKKIKEVLVFNKPAFFFLWGDPNIY